MTFNTSLAQNVTNLGQAALEANAASDSWIAVGWLFIFFVVFVASTYRQDRKSSFLVALTLTLALAVLFFFMGMIAFHILGFVFALWILMLMYYIFGEE